MSESETAAGEAPGETPPPTDATEPTAPPPEPAASPQKRLMRSRDDRVIAGVCGGLGKYLGVDAVLIRIAALILVFAGGAGLILYVIAWIAMPEVPLGGTGDGAAAPAPTAPGERTTGAMILGLVFVVLGVFYLFDQALPDIVDWEWVWPVALIAVGALVLLRARR
jgi:phage shock protein C